MDEHVDDLVEELYPSLQEWRRDFHKYAESGWVEFRTASIVASKLASWGYEVKAGREVIAADARMGVPPQAFLKEQEQRALSQGAVAEWLPYLSGGFTGVVGILDSGRSGPTVAFRVDMDALDLQESHESDHLPVAGEFVSINDKMMHACGHDAHTSIGLGLAYVLSQCKDGLYGRVKLIFQPAEEGVRGAKAMVEAGVADDVDLLFACHVGTGVPLREVVCGTYGYLATTKMDVVYTGIAAHAGGSPEEGRNALLAAASAVMNLHSIPRHSEGNSRINVGVLEAGSGRNIIPNHASFKLETRGDTSEVNEYILARAIDIIHGSVQMYGVESKIDIVGKAGSSDPSPELLPYIRAQAGRVKDVESIVDTTSAGGSEDATYLMERVKQHGGLASYLLFGTTLAAGHHNEKFDIEEETMKIAVKTLALCALNAHEVSIPEPTAQHT
ncbi:peptidase M20 [Brevibacillus choshinensis]|uniref:Peptidase M20 n=1 Tax=Brevibacillus choshinensis TaxID=54911 RepID=A0ABR5N7S6_BRECH|nr:amidohydrolase [Brevibacillus choshinensis]KQL46673.1 peptidase M20 [Brevibacillus choshinensis]